MKTTRQIVIDTYLKVKSIRKTAALTGYSKSGVSHILNTSGIPHFPRNRPGPENSQRKAISNRDTSDPSQLIRNPAYMHQLYVVQKLSTTEIGKLLDLTPGTILTGLEQCGIQPRSKSEALKGKPHPSAQGSKSHNWRGGLSGWRKLARGRLNEHFVRPIMERDCFRCQWCSSTKNLVVHHHKRTFMEIVDLIRKVCAETDIDAFVNAIVSEHSLDDGITLCKQCHDNFHKENGQVGNWPR